VCGGSFDLCVGAAEFLWVARLSAPGGGAAAALAARTRRGSRLGCDPALVDHARLSQSTRATIRRCVFAAALRLRGRRSRRTRCRAPTDSSSRPLAATARLRLSRAAGGRAEPARLSSTSATTCRRSTGRERSPRSAARATMNFGARHGRAASAGCRTSWRAQAQLGTWRAARWRPRGRRRRRTARLIASPPSSSDSWSASWPGELGPRPGDLEQGRPWPGHLNGCAAAARFLAAGVFANVRSPTRPHTRMRSPSRLVWPAPPRRGSSNLAKRSASVSATRRAG